MLVIAKPFSSGRLLERLLATSNTLPQFHVRFVPEPTFYSVLGLWKSSPPVSIKFPTGVKLPEYGHAKDRSARTIWSIQERTSRSDLVLVLSPYFPCSTPLLTLLYLYSGLAMTRALGHAILSKYGVIAAPEHYRTAIRYLSSAWRW